MFTSKFLSARTATQWVALEVTLIGIILIVCLIGVVYNTSAKSQGSIVVQNSENAPFVTSPITTSIQVFLPLAIYWPPPAASLLNPIPNTDQDNFYAVSWNGSELADYYTLEEATNALFTDAKVVYQGDSLTWDVTGQGKTPATYYYRVTASNSWGNSPQSNIQSVIIHPLFIGLNLQWNGEGYIRYTDTSYDVGTHLTRVLDVLTDPDTIGSHNLYWYDPNPQGWASSNWYSYFSISTGAWKSSSVSANPDWKWENPWILPYDFQLSDNQIVLIADQPFYVSGPLAGYTAFGQAVQYWQLTNTEQFLYWDDGSGWTQYIHPGDIELWFDAGNTRLLLHSDIFRNWYFQGDLTPNTVQYVENLTASNSFPGFTQALETMEVFFNLPFPIYPPERNVNIK